MGAYLALMASHANAPTAPTALSTISHFLQTQPTAGSDIRCLKVSKSRKKNGVLDSSEKRTLG